MLKRIQGLFRFEDLLVGARFIWELQRFLRRPLRLDEAQNILRRRLEHREADFLALARNAIYANPRSPYLELLRLAGCEYGDLERLVRRDGLEGALRALFERGVYLTVDEFKGREPAIRGSASVSLVPEQLRNPNSAIHLLMQTSGSRGPRQRVPIDLAYIRDVAVHGLLTDTARGADDWVRAIWVVPGGSALYYFLGYGAYGVYPARWFSQVDPAASGLDRRYSWSGYALRLGSMLAGIRCRVLSMCRSMLRYQSPAGWRSAWRPGGRRTWGPSPAPPGACAWLPRRRASIYRAPSFSSQASQSPPRCCRPSAAAAPKPAHGTAAWRQARSPRVVSNRTSLTTCTP
jgi:hypothetical protein